MAKDGTDKLVWNVYAENRYVGLTNTRANRIKVHNVFEHYGFMDDCRRAYKACKGDREKFEKSIESGLMYYYWSKCEWEVIIAPWPPLDYGDIKEDVYSQVMMNRDRFMDYLWENRDKLKER